MPADVELNVRVTKKGDGADAVARDLKGAARAADDLDDNLGQVNRQLVEMKVLAVAAAKEFQKTGDLTPLKEIQKQQRELQQVQRTLQGVAEAEKRAAEEAAAAAKRQADAEKRGAEEAALALKVAAVQANSLEDNLQQVEHRLIEIKALSLAAGKSFLATGDINPLNQLRQEEQHLKQVRNLLANAVEDTGPTVFAKIGQEIASHPYIAAGIAGAIVLGAPVIGAAVSGAVLAGIGAAGIGAGIAAQFSNPAVKGVIADFGNQFKTEFQAVSESFIDPIDAGLVYLKRDLEPFIQDLRGAFETIAPYVATLFDKLGQGAAAFGKGLTNALERSGPALEELGTDVVIIGQAVGQFLDDLSQHDRGAVEGLRTVVLLIAEAIGNLGDFLGAMADVYDFIVRVDEKMVDFLSKWPVIGQILEFSGIKDKVHEVAGSYVDANGQVSQSNRDTAQSAREHAEATKKQAEAEKEAADEARYEKQALQELQEFVSKQANTILGAQQAQLQFNASLMNMHDTLQQNKHAFDEHSKAGIADREAVIAAAQAAVELRDRTLAATGSTEDADKAFQGAVGQVRALGKQMHLTDAEIDGVIGGLLGLHSPPPIIVDLKRLGYTDPEIATLKAQIEGLHNKLTTVQIDYISRHIDVFGTGIGGLGHLGGQAKGGVILRAAQGLVSGILPPRSPGTMVLAGEPQTGGEVFAPLKGISRSRAMSLASVIGDAYGFDVGGRGGAVTGRSGGSRAGGAAPVLSYSGSTGGLDGLFLSWLQKQIRNGYLTVS